MKQFDERDQGAPRVWSVNNESLQKDFGYNLSEAIVLHLHKQVEQQRAKPVGVGVRVSKMEYDRAEEMVLA